jgi:puromycin-sensitive aminopeptidase
LVSAAADGTTLRLRQQRFGYGDVHGDGATGHWSVPIHVRAAGEEWRVLLNDTETSLAVPAGDAPVVVNAGGRGFVRVAYDPGLRARLSGPALSKLTVTERYNLVDDAWNEVLAGRLPAIDYLAFVEGFAGDRDLAVWQAIALGLRGLGRLVDGEAHEALRARVVALARGALADLGWEPREGEDGLQAKLRGLLVVLTAVNGADPAATARCRALLDGGTTDPELIAAATSAVAANGDAGDYDRYVDGYRHAATPQDQMRHLYALAEFPTAELLDRTVELAFSDEVKTQNAPFLLRATIGNRWHGAHAWAAVRDRWDEANDRFPSSSIVRMVDSVRLLTEPAQVEEVHAFFAEHPIPQAATTLTQVLERQRVNAALRERDAEPFAAALLAT